jgi:peptidoglycan/xylan/chitin deacetylase (PgdA/CDA1 family)
MPLAFILLLGLLLGLTSAAPMPASRPALVGIVTHGSRNSPWVALTFDADMTPGMERALQGGRVKSYDNVMVRQILRATRTPATFFFTGMWAETYPVAARSIAADPLFEIEDHSYDHPGFAQPCYGLATISDADKAPDIRRAQLAIRRVTGRTPRYFRFPGGCASVHDVQVVQKLGLTTVDWDVISGDAGQSDPQVIIHNVLRQTRDGSIIVMHSHGGKAPATALALPAIISGLKARGFVFVTVQELLGTR